MKLILSLGGALCSLFLTACTDTKQTNGPSPMLVKTATAQPVSTSDRKEFPFISKPFRSSELSFRVSGPIDRFEGYTGSFYKRVELIAQIDPRDFEIRLENCRALYRQAKAEFERVEALFRKGNLAAGHYEKAHAEFVAAKTALQKAENELNDTKPTAPFDGYIETVHIERFQEVRASQPVIAFADISRLRIEVFVTQEIVLQAPDLSEPSLRRGSEPGLPGGIGRVCQKHDAQQPLLPADSAVAE